MLPTLIDVTSSTEFLAGVGGALIGSLSSGLVSFVLQKSALNHQRTRNEKETLDRHRAIASSFVIKLSVIANNYTNFTNYLEGCVANFDEKNHMYMCQVIVPLANFPKYVEFSTDEVALFLQHDGHHLCNKIMLSDERHNSLIDAIKLLCEERRNLFHRIQPDTYEGNVLSAGLTQYQITALMPKIVEVESLISSIRKNLKINSDEILAIGKEISTFFNQKLGLKLKLERRQSEHR